LTISELGSDECGAYKDGDDGGMPLQNVQTNPGYGGTNTRAIYMHMATNARMENLYIHNIMSLNGPSYGVYLYASALVDFVSTKFEHIDAGLQLTNENKDFSMEQWPNLAARSCALEYVGSTTTNTSEFQITTSCMFGHAHCICDDGNPKSGTPSCGSVVSECATDATYDLTYSTVHVSSNGEVDVKVKENGGYQPQSFEEFDLKLKKMQSNNIDNGNSHVRTAIIISIIGVVMSLSIIFGLYFIVFKSPSKVQHILHENYDYKRLIQH